MITCLINKLEKKVKKKENQIYIKIFIKRNIQILIQTIFLINDSLIPVKFSLIYENQ